MPRRSRTRRSISSCRNDRAAQAEREVVLHRHVRIERVGLEHHRDVAILGRHVVDDASVDRQRAGRDRLEPRDHAQRRGLAAARRSEQHHELAVADARRRHRPRAAGRMHRGRSVLVSAVELDDRHSTRASSFHRAGGHALDQLLGEERVDRRSTGMIAIISPVAIMPTSSCVSPMKRWMPSGSVRLASSVISTTANRNSFHSRMKLRMTVVAIAGSAIGSADAPEDLPVGIAVHPRGVEQVARDAREEALEDVDRERQLDRDVDQRQAERGCCRARSCTRIWNSEMIVICGGKMIVEKSTK